MTVDRILIISGRIRVARYAKGSPDVFTMDGLVMFLRIEREQRLIGESLPIRAFSRILHPRLMTQGQLSEH